ncbi:hypothetical protein EON63_22935 [archaeon]|nr:MAG: hypothetical protein EON63_22935 [archaeon]
MRCTLELLQGGKLNRLNVLHCAHDRLTTADYDNHVKTVRNCQPDRCKQQLLKHKHKLHKLAMIRPWSVCVTEYQQ